MRLLIGCKLVRSYSPSHLTFFPSRILFIILSIIFWWRLLHFIFSAQTMTLNGPRHTLRRATRIFSYTTNQLRPTLGCRCCAKSQRQPSWSCPIASSVFKPGWPFCYLLISAALTWHGRPSYSPIALISVYKSFIASFDSFP